MDSPECIFCQIAAGKLPARIVYEDAETMAFLEIRPLFPGHVLLCPREHYETLADLPAEMTGPMMGKMQLLSQAVEAAVDAEGTFLAINNKVSQSVPHLHIHIVPRRKRDGLRGFFWPRIPYKDDEAREAVGVAIAREVQKLLE